MLVEVKDLKPGDEVLCPSNSHLKYVKIIRPPKLSKKTNRYGTAWGSTRVDITTSSYTAWNGKLIVRTHKEYICTPEEHNIEEYFNLNYRSIWLVREG